MALALPAVAMAPVLDMPPKYGGAIRSKSLSPVELWFTRKVIHSNIVINLGRATFDTEACLASR